MMLDKKILIIDDKDANHSHSSRLLISTIPEEFLLFVDHYENHEYLWTKRDDKLYPTIDLLKYAYVFIHDSYDNPIFLTEDKHELKSIFDNNATFVFFSGEKAESNKPYMQDDGSYGIRRSQYFSNFITFLESFKYFQKDNLDFLFNSSLKPIRRKIDQLAEVIITKLETSTKYAADSKEFDEILELRGYTTPKKQAIVLRVIREEANILELIDIFKS